MLDVSILKELSEAFGPSGDEDDVKRVVLKYLEDLEHKEDRFGNLIFFRKGRHSTRKFMVVSHMDEIGFMVYFKRDTYVKLMPVGGWDHRILLAHRVKIKTKQGFVYGVFSSVAPHVQRSESFQYPSSVERYYVDVVGNHDKVSIGDMAVIDYPFTQLSENYFLGKAFDDRVGCFLNILLAKHSQPYYDTYFVFTVQEEVGLRGAFALGIDADLALVLECTSADSPYLEDDQQVSYLSKGPVLTIADRSIIVKKDILRWLENKAKKHGIPYQFKRPFTGSTDAGAIARYGLNSIVVSVPARYIHSPLQIVDLRDIEHTYNLAKVVVENA